MTTVYRTLRVSSHMISAERAMLITQLRAALAIPCTSRCPEALYRMAPPAAQTNGVPATAAQFEDEVTRPRMFELNAHPSAHGD
jgi:hypothetical protein